MSISSDEVNYLVYRYLQENGFAHSAFTFSYESLVAKSSVVHTDLSPGALVTFLQKGLEYVTIEEHIKEVRFVGFYLRILDHLMLIFSLLLVPLYHLHHHI